MEQILNSPALAEPSLSRAAALLREHADSEEAAPWKIRLRTRDLLGVMNCVQCNLCRLHGKVTVAGFAAALQAPPPAAPPVRLPAHLPSHTLPGPRTPPYLLPGSSLRPLPRCCSGTAAGGTTATRRRTRTRSTESRPATLTLALAQTRTPQPRRGRPSLTLTQTHQVAALVVTGGKLVAACHTVETLQALEA